MPCKGVQPHRRPTDTTDVTRDHLRLTAKTLLILLLALSTARCVSRPMPRPPEPPSSTTTSRDARRETLLVGVEVDGRYQVQRLDLEDYVRGAVATEMPVLQADPAVARRVARLQAILARTYALANRGRHTRDGFDVCSETHCQVYRGVDTQTPAVSRLVAAAVEDTRGQVISDGHRPIDAVYHADCGGHTSSATAVWGGTAPAYLKGVRDRFCVTTPGDDWRLTLDLDHLRRVLNTADDTRIGSRLDRLRVAGRDAAGRVVDVEVSGARTVTVRGERFRAVIAHQLGARAFRSTRFRVTPRGDQVEFSGNGFGHGVGLCQTGAIARARRGHTIGEILAHYYPGTALTILPTRTS